MEMMPIEVYSSETNRSIIRSPNRQHPALVVQLDNFMGMFHYLCAARLAIQSNHLREADETLESLDRMMRARLVHYQDVIEEHGLKMSSSWPPMMPRLGLDSS